MDVEVERDYTCNNQNKIKSSKSSSDIRNIPACLHGDAKLPTEGILKYKIMTPRTERSKINYLCSYIYTIYIHHQSTIYYSSIYMQYIIINSAGRSGSPQRQRARVFGSRPKVVQRSPGGISGSVDARGSPRGR